MTNEELPLLVAYRDKTLSVEAAKQLVAMSEDASCRVHTGDDLPLADKGALLRKAALVQHSR